MQGSISAEQQRLAYPDIEDRGTRGPRATGLRGVALQLVKQAQSGLVIDERPAANCPRRIGRNRGGGADADHGLSARTSSIRIFPPHGEDSRVDYPFRRRVYFDADPRQQRYGGSAKLIDDIKQRRRQRQARAEKESRSPPGKKFRAKAGKEVRSSPFPGRHEVSEPGIHDHES